MNLRLRAFALLCCLFVGCTAYAQENPYLAAGVPATDRVWTGKDYIAVATIFESDKVQLPVLTDGFGAAVFRRIVNMENLAACRDKSVPLDERLENCGEMQIGFGRILSAYGRKVAEDTSIHTELATLLGFALHSGSLVLNLIDERPVPAADDTVAADQRQRLNVGLAMVFTGTEQSLGQYGFYSAEDLSLLLVAMDATFPEMRTTLSPEYRVELKAILTRHLAHFTGEDLAHLKHMLETLPLPLEPIEPPPRREVEEVDSN